jgi:SNF2 family DNA or RNA helicase
VNDSDDLVKDLVCVRGGKLDCNSLKKELLMHQKESLYWCNRLEEDGIDMTKFYGPSHASPDWNYGGFLADEVGMGKTVVMISLMCVRPVGLTLVISPPYLLRQWEEQINQFSNLRCKVMYCSKKETFAQMVRDDILDVIVVGAG